MSTRYYDMPYKPNATQAEVHKNLKRYNVIVVHRGLGKTYLTVQQLIKDAMTCPTRGADFVYAAPLRTDAERIAWKAFKEALQYYVTDSDGKRRLDANGQPILRPIEDLKIREDKLTITFLHNNATIHVVGTDNPDSLRGIHPFGFVLDEAGLHSRDVFEGTIIPSIQRNNGYLILIGTPDRHQRLKELYELARTEQEAGGDWYTMFRDVNSTGIYTNEQIADIIKLQGQSTFEIEYLLKWEAKFNGAYYSEMLTDPTKNLVTDVPWNPQYPVITGWDLGLKDPSTIWFLQQIDGKNHLIDYFEATDRDIYSLISVVKNKPYRYAYHVLPHDVTVRSSITLDTRENVFRRCGMKIHIAPKIAVQEGIGVVQSALYTCRFDRIKCIEGLKHLKAYTAKIDKLTGHPMAEPDHKHSDAADALRTLFVGIRKAATTAYHESTLFPNKKEIVSDYDYFEGSHVDSTAISF